MRFVGLGSNGSGLSGYSGAAERAEKAPCLHDFAVAASETFQVQTFRSAVDVDACFKPGQGLMQTAARHMAMVLESLQHHC